jgi:small subunit ribosomal protein S1
MHLAREETSAEETRSLTVEEPKTTDAAEQDGVPAGSGVDPTPATEPLEEPVRVGPDALEASAVEAAPEAAEEASPAPEAEVESAAIGVAAVVEAETPVTDAAAETEPPVADANAEPESHSEPAASSEGTVDQQPKPAATAEGPVDQQHWAVAEADVSAPTVTAEAAATAEDAAIAEDPVTAEAVAPVEDAAIAEAAVTAEDAAIAEDPVTAEDGAPVEAAAPIEDAAPQAAEPVRPIDDRPEPTTMEELLNEQAGDIRSLKHGDVVEGTVVRIDKDEMLVDIGAKSEGVVSNRELYGRNSETQPELSIGDTVLVYVLQPESQEGHAVLSLRRAGLERKWRGMQEQFDEGVIIEAPVIDHNKGGLIVDCGIRGFVPISQIVDFPRRPQNDQPRDAAQEIAEKLQPYVGRKLRLKILEVNRKANRLILSEKVALYEERREKRDELFSSLQVGQKVTGTVRSIAPFGVFVDLGGIDGLVHKSELSWNKVNNPEAGYQIGEEVEAEVIDINHERGRISLSIRRLQPDPWQSTVADLKVGDIVDGTVTKIVNFGAFVRVKDGLEGLIHISELSHQRVAHPGDVVHEGQTLKLKVISLDSERHRLGLSLKQAEEAPARPARERRPRPERGYDTAQAIQEPEGGIDNTLAAAFAQVRQQIAEQDAARSVEVDEDGATAADAPAAEAPAVDLAADDLAAADTPATEAPAAESEASILVDDEPEMDVSAGEPPEAVATPASEPDDDEAEPAADVAAVEVDVAPEPPAEPAADLAAVEIDVAPEPAAEPEVVELQATEIDVAPEPEVAEPEVVESQATEVEAAPPAEAEAEADVAVEVASADVADAPPAADTEAADAAIEASDGEAPTADARAEETDEVEKVEA